MFSIGDLYKERARQYGYLYNHYAVQAANFAPNGWRVPTMADAEELADMISTAAELKDQGDWNDDPGIDRGTDIHGFRALPCGFRNSSGGFAGENYNFRFWTSTIWQPWSGVSAHYAYLSGGLNSFSVGSLLSVKAGCSIRFLKENSTMPAGNQVRDYEGNVYPVARIDDGVKVRIWTALNWRSIRLMDGVFLQHIPSASAWESANTAAYCAYDNLEQNI